jgi:hypothetical protein
MKLPIKGNNNRDDKGHQNATSTLPLILMTIHSSNSLGRTCQNLHESRGRSGSKHVQWGNGDIGMDSDEEGWAETWVAADKTSCLNWKKQCQNTDR